MRAGKLRHRLQIQERTTNQDSYGDALQTWATVATVWGSVEDEAGQEPWQADQQRPARTGVVKIRFYPGLTSRHRIIHGTRTLNLESVLDTDGWGREMLVKYREEA